MKKRHPGRIRSGIQLGFLALFFLVFIKIIKEKLEKQFLAGFFIFHPLSFPLTFLASPSSGRIALILFFTWLILVVSTFLFGRFYCGFICPLGTLQDIFGTLFLFIRAKLPGGKVHSRAAGGLSSGKKIKYILLFIMLVTSVAGLQLYQIFDPAGILMRGSISIYSWKSEWFLNLTSVRIQDRTKEAVLDTIHSWFVEHVFPREPYIFAGGNSFGFMLFLILLLTSIRRRFFCRFVCPAGAMLAFFSMRVRSGIVMKTDCTGCNRCQNLCPVDAIREGNIESSECILCLDCIGCCSCLKYGRIHRDNNGGNSGELYRVPSGFPESRGRRSLIIGILTSLAGIFIFTKFLTRSSGRKVLVRPPGFNNRTHLLCTRCGTCYAVCPNNALHPSFLEEGIDHFWTPRIIPRIGHCTLECSACGEICPTGALRAVPYEKRLTKKIGLARIDMKKCITWATHETCGVCEEHCPVPSKAIKMELRGKVMYPFVDRNLCVGCGACEKVCPVEGESAIRVFPVRETE